MPQTAPTDQIYQIKITLRDSKPPIWRRVELPSATTLPKLHSIIQTVMGWYDYHLHQFKVGRIVYGVPDPDDYIEVHDERRVKLNQVLANPKDKFVYEYDFGDSWEHVVELEQILPPDPSASYPRCTAGKRSGPPEDCGGIWGYAGLLDTLADPGHPEHATMLEWVGGDFDPELFDLEATNQALHPPRSRARGKKES